LRDTEAPMPGRSLVEFFYCASCPSSYLAFVRLQEVAIRTGATVALRPVVAAWLPSAGAAGSISGDAHDAATRYALKDLGDWARFCGVTLTRPLPPACDAGWVQRGAIVAGEARRSRAYAAAAFEARFGLGRDLAGREAALALAVHCGLEAGAFAAALDSAGTRSALTDNGDELLRRGGFATPAMFLGEDMFVGHERVPLLEWAVMRASERPFIAPGEHGR
jgi:2-hydroxychromene-2-carboxylate isomerase